MMKYYINYFLISKFWDNFSWEPFQVADITPDLPNIVPVEKSWFSQEGCCFESWHWWTFTINDKWTNTYLQKNKEERRIIFERDSVYFWTYFKVLKKFLERGDELLDMDIKLLNSLINDFVNKESQIVLTTTSKKEDIFKMIEELLKLVPEKEEESRIKNETQISLYGLKDDCNIV